MALPPQPHFGFISIFNRGDSCAFHLDKSHNLKFWICLKFNGLFQYYVMSSTAASRDGQSRNGKAARFGTFWICLMLIFCGAHSTVPKNLLFTPCIYNIFQWYQLKDIL